MSYQRVKQQKISDMIADKVEEMILEGTFQPGQKLPPERELAAQFEVSRPSLREAMQKLTAKGLVVSRQGGGTYISKELGISIMDPLLELFKSHPEAQYDLLEFRHALEGVTAYYAALRSTVADKEAIQASYAQLQQYHDNNEFEKEVAADVNFHLTIAASTHNVVLLHMMRALFSLLKQHVGDNLLNIYPRPGYREKIHEQHKMIMEAILDASPEKAQQAAHVHLAYVEEALLEGAKEHTRLERALRRRMLES